MPWRRRSGRTQPSIQWIDLAGPHLRLDADHGGHARRVLDNEGNRASARTPASAPVERASASAVGNQSWPIGS